MRQDLGFSASQRKESRKQGQKWKPITSDKKMVFNMCKIQPEDDIQMYVSQTKC